MPKSDINENREKYSPGLLYGVVWSCSVTIILLKFVPDNLSGWVIYKFTQYNVTAGIKFGED